MATRSLGFFLWGFVNPYFRGWKMLKIAPCTPAFPFVNPSIRRRLTPIEPKVLGVHGREVDLRASGVSEASDAGVGGVTREIEIFLLSSGRARGLCDSESGMAVLFLVSLGVLPPPAAAAGGPKVGSKPTPQPAVRHLPGGGGLHQAGAHCPVAP